MKVGELVEILKELPQDKQVFDFINDEIEDVVEDDDGVYIT